MVNSTLSNDTPNFRTEGPIPPPIIDPTNASYDAIIRGDKAERDYVDGEIRVLETRIDAMDQATKVLSGNVNRTPTLLQTAIKSFGELMAEKFKAVDDKFLSAESLRLEQKQDSKTGLDAALAAQEESASIQDVNNQKAIDKSEKATAEIIKNNQDANKQAIDTLTKGLDELKLEVSKITAIKQGATENRTETRAKSNLSGMWIGLIVAGVGTFITLILGITGIAITLLLRGN